MKLLVAEATRDAAFIMLTDAVRTQTTVILETTVAYLDAAFIIVTEAVRV